MSDEIKILLGLAACSAIAYLLGSLNFAIIVTRLFLKKDIRTMGSGNAGLTNVLRCVGKFAALLVLMGDLAKAILSVLIAGYLYPLICGGSPVIGAYAAAFMVIVGHIFPLFDHFKGGKGVLCAAGAMLILDARVFAVCFFVFAVVMFLTRIVSASSILAILSLPVATYVLHSINGDHLLYTTLVSLLISVLIIFKHRSNIRRLLEGTEKKLSFKKKEN